MPWQMNKTLIINLSYLKMPKNAQFCKVLRCFRGIRFFFSKTTQFAKCGKIRQDVPFIRSKIVVKIDLFTTMDILS